MSAERWAAIPGFEGRYEASTAGRIRQASASPRRRAGFIVPQNGGAGEYRRIGLMVDGRSRTFYVHRLVAETFMPAHAKGAEVNHINGDKTDNRIENLEWVTHAENMAHAARVLRSCGGPKKWLRRLTDEQVRAIRTDSRPGRAIAADYGLSQCAIHHIKSRKTYKEVE